MALGGGGDVGDGRGVEGEARHERVLELHEPGIRMDDLDPDDLLLDRAVQQATDLEPAEADPLADLRLAEVQPVVELGDPHHLADVAGAPLGFWTANKPFVALRSLI